MASDSIFTRAREIIGRQEDDDWKIEPTRHADNLQKRAPQLAAILQSSEVSTEAQRYERSDTEAVAVQNQYKVLVSRANLFVFYSSVLSALVLAANGWLQDPNRARAVAAIGVAAVVCAALARMWLTQAEGNQLFERWMENRATAETMRLEYFRLAATMTHNAGEGSSKGEVPLELMQLEYFRRFQLDVQLAFYEGRGKQHREQSSKTVRWSSYASLATMLGSGLAAAGGAFLTEWAGDRDPRGCRSSRGIASREP